MRRLVVTAGMLALSIVGGAAGCAYSKLAYAPDELRAEVSRRAPTIPPGEIVVPFEITAEQAARARELVKDAQTESDRVRLLVAAFFDPAGFGLRYAWGVTASAEETFRISEGNCLSLASAFVGLARAVGLSAHYMDASVRVHETRHGGDGITVNAGHVTAVIRSGGTNVALDFARLGPIRWYRVIDDVEALAHFYNNRGFDLVEQARDRGADAAWAEALHSFGLAVQVAPGFAPAWNNLGIAAAHLGHGEEAMRHYRAAVASDPTLAAPRNNLGALLLRRGDLRAALEELEAAARLDPKGPHIQLNLAMARLGNRDREGAARALQRAIDLRGSYPEAEALLAEVAPP